MRSAQFSVIRYIADPGRNEELNVGVLVWDELNYLLRLDDAAIGRVVRDHPRLAKDALYYLAPMLEEQIKAIGTSPGEAIEPWIASQRGYPVVLTDPRFAGIGDQPDGLEAAVEALVHRVVRPGKRPGGGGLNPVQMLARGLQPLLKSRAVMQNYFLKVPAGRPRKVDFFANSGANVAINALPLAVKEASEIQKRVDAEAFAIEQIRKANDVRSYLVFCTQSQDDAYASIYEDARQILESVSATVVTDVEEAVRQIDMAVKSHHSHQLVLASH